MKKIIILFALAFFGISLTSVAQARLSQNTKIEKFDRKKGKISKRDRHIVKKNHKAFKQSLRIAKADGSVTRGERKLLKKQKINSMRTFNRKGVKLNRKSRIQPRC